ncbi:Os01g0252150 [Oryza sativa Japonica Group]|uniref:Os01g0252150 protein n=1 Tax=Oryza sativa subsp. japonica TaxID=39947 RepID=A0A0P0V0M9_ORYSJ|nr:hypothetical protein EE612_001496 [Oryza sativa]BAS71355.1 Os01g0252150 [Oryza sativa Japonica Group]
MEYLVPWVCFNLWKLELGIVWIHAFNFLPCRCSKDLRCVISFNKIQPLTCPNISSARTHPADQMSIAVVYSVAPNMSSGAL